ncbi:TRAP transporter small permease [Roseovarius spongiae]|uniref:TRAP transporter small permease protein n=1 Tax=Roseovarius spongiae TaxID=2320272 RepID=A0A3A8ARN4_9RHOB|nr:TRAP transporter small permease [Roseovarius spongiae]RKF13580.1 TRAP transporter small permease [Roseovarius spongiae]
MTRRLLTRLYDLAGLLAGLCLVGIGVTIIVQIVGRLMGVTVDSTESAGLLLAATMFFGLAHTFQHGGHVRITLAVHPLPPGLRRGAEIFNCVVAGAAVCYLAWNITDLALQSYEYHDVSPGLLAIPFWIPQAAAAAGVILFAVSILDELIWIIAGRPPRYDGDPDSEITHSE